jgi:hypothetical protein
MAKSVLYMSMSLDGFITGPDDGPGQRAWVGRFFSRRKEREASHA